MWGYGDVEMWGYGDVEMWRCGDVVKWRCCEASSGQLVAESQQRTAESQQRNQPTKAARYVLYCYYNQQRYQIRPLHYCIR